MSGGSGQMPMASNAGQQQQQMQQPMMGQMGMQPQGMMGGQPQIAQQMVGSPALDQAAFQQMMQAQQMQGGMQPATGIASLGGQMPMASNQGQQMQNPQMGMQNALDSFNQQGNMGQMPPQGGMFGAPMMQTAQPQGMMGGQIAQQMPGGPQMDQSMLQQMMQAQQMQGAGGGMQPAMGIAALNSKPMQGAMGAPMDYATPRTQSDMNPYQQNPNQVDMRPTNMQQQQSAPPLPGAGMPPGYRPTSGTIDGKHLRDMMDIYRSRFMEGGPGDGRRDRNRLPGAIGNDLPPSLKRPTQGNYKGFK